MEGLLLIDKPSGFTSHRVVSIIRQKLSIKKVGHAGTLDPLATGLLIIMLGKATKLSNQLISQAKSYLVTAQLFLATDTGDIQGRVIKKLPKQIWEKKEVKKIVNLFNNYTYYQTPPLYSAIKIQGKKLYEYARRQIEIVIPPRLVTIKSIKLLSYEPILGLIKFSVECSKGTYIRSLVQDIAEKLGTIGTVQELRRLSSGNFHVKQAICLNEINSNNIYQLLIKNF